jgi:hypothetical protein
MINEAPLIITGMHRSGTSLIASFVHHSGIDLGNDLLGPRKSNPYGHFEDKEILDFHRDILVREFGHSMWVPGPPEVTEEDRQRTTQLIAARRHKPRWGWKEPRTSLFLDVWNRLLPDARFLFVVRHPLQVLDSLSRRTKSKFYQFRKHNKFLRAWMTYNHECASFYHRHHDRSVLVDIELVISDPATFVETLSQLLSFDFSTKTFRRLYEPGALTRKTTHTLLASPELRSASLSFYQQLTSQGEMSEACELARGEPDPSLHYD